MSLTVLVTAVSIAAAAAAMGVLGTRAFYGARRRVQQRRLAASTFGVVASRLPSGPCPDVSLSGVLHAEAGPAEALTTFFPRGALRLEPEDALALARPAQQQSDWLLVLEDHVSVRLGESTIVVLGSTNRAMDASDLPSRVFVDLPVPPPGTPKRLYVRAVRHGERARVRGSLALEAHSTEVGFREPSRGWHLNAPSPSPGRFAAVVVATDEPPRASARSYLAGAAACAALALGVFALVELVVVRRSLVASNHEPSAPFAASSNQAPCARTIEEALESADPWTALRILETCDAPLLRAQANWLTGEFEAASDAFATARRQDGYREGSVTEIESHLFAGHLDRAEDSLTSLLARSLTDKATDDATLRCIQGALNMRLRPDIFPYRADLANASPMCRILMDDAAGANGATALALTPEILRFIANGQTMTARRRLVEAFAVEQSVSSGVSSDWKGSPLWVNFRTDVGNAPGEDPGRYLRFRPIALHTSVERKLNALHPNDGRAHELLVDLSLDDAFAWAFAGEAATASSKLSAARQYLNGKADRAHADSSTVTPSHLMLAAWTSFHAHQDDDALRFATSHEDTYGTERVRHAINFRNRREGPDYDEQNLKSPDKEIFALGLRGDGVALAHLLAERREGPGGVLYRVLPRLDRGQEEMRTWAKTGYPPPRCWTCGITALFEYLAERRRVATGLAIGDLEVHLGKALRSVLAAMSNRSVAVLWLGLEVAYNEPASPGPQ